MKLERNLIAIGAVLALAGTVLAGADSLEVKAHKSAGEQTVIEGELVCTACTLKKAEGAHAQCKLYGHEHSILTKDGKYIAFLPNQHSVDLQKGEAYVHKHVKVHGTYYANANLLDVDWFEVDGKKLGWCEKDQAMDEHGAK